ncbi:MAG TPA: hypothetical protein VGN72_17365 [Tepidisphaeraceae bacterium]|jgi:hypothetical protein|nr:hypothetical protein [Tepidisphaeraceae bacterium]
MTSFTNQTDADADIAPLAGSALPTGALDSSVLCPACRWPFVAGIAGPVACGHCNWRGEAYEFPVKRLQVMTAESALPEDSVCAHHPRKRATAVCAGTGDYICALCAVEIDGQTYGAEYLAAGGKEKAAKAFDRTLPRPDNHVYTYLICLFIPYVNVVMIPFAFIWVPHAVVLYFRALRMRRENPLFARLMGRGRVIMMPVLLTIVSALWLLGVGFGAYALLENL